jgi:hypothetical protein
VVFVGWMMSRRDVRPSLFNVLRTFAQPVVLGTTLGLAAYTAALAFLGDRLGIWETGLIKETVLWYL